VLITSCDVIKEKLLSLHPYY